MAYRFEQYLDFLDAVVSAGIPTRSLRKWNKPGLYILHDIHQELQQCRSFAREEAGRGITANYFFMAAAEKYNKEWFGTDEMFNVLSCIRQNGGELGLHIDPFELDEFPKRWKRLFYPTVHSNVRYWKKYFRKHGFPMAVANIHGSTRFWRSGMIAPDFFAESMRDKAVLEGHKIIRFWQHFGKYRLKRLPFRRIVTLSFVYNRWRRRFTYPDYYISDNSTQLTLHRVDKSADRSLLYVDYFANVEHLKQSGKFDAVEANMEIRSQPWIIDSATIDTIVKRIAGKRTLALIHPQWFEGAEKNG